MISKLKNMKILKLKENVLIKTETKCVKERQILTAKNDTYCEKMHKKLKLYQYIGKSEKGEAL